MLIVHCERLDRHSVSAENQHKLIASKCEKYIGTSVWIVAIAAFYLKAAMACYV